MSKKLAASQTFKLLVPSGKASPSPPVGPALGQRGVKSMDFCKLFNDATKHYIQGLPIPTLITVNPDRTFTFVTKTPQTSYLLMQAAGVEKGSSKNLAEKVGTISLKHLYEIAKIKEKDFKGLDLERICRIIKGQCHSLGIDVVP